jgi:hypothetical protein
MVANRKGAAVLLLRATWIGLSKGGDRKTVKADGGHDAYYSVEVRDEDAQRTSKFELQDRRPLAQFESLTLGEPVVLQMAAYPKRVKKQRQDGSEYPSTAFDLSVVGVAA